VKLKIINANYVYRYGRMQPSERREDKPWRVCGSGRIKGFPTHAEAIQYAANLVSEAKIRELRAMQFYDLSYWS
jgi:hypothetical protein